MTVRAADDGRFLARVIQREGVPFVLDYGDHPTIQGLSRKLLAGFSMDRAGEPEVVTSTDTKLMLKIANHYASIGFLVTYEEPDWPMRPEFLLQQSRQARPIVDPNTDTILRNLGDELSLDDDTDLRLPFALEEDDEETMIIRQPPKPKR